MEISSNGIEFGAMYYMLDRFLTIMAKEENTNILIYNLISCIVIVQSQSA